MLVLAHCECKDICCITCILQNVKAKSVGENTPRSNNILEKVQDSLSDILKRTAETCDLSSIEKVGTIVCLLILSYNA